MNNSRQVVPSEVDKVSRALRASTISSDRGPAGLVAEGAILSETYSKNLRSSSEVAALGSREVRLARHSNKLKDKTL